MKFLLFLLSIFFISLPITLINCLSSYPSTASSVMTTACTGGQARSVLYMNNNLYVACDSGNNVIYFAGGIATHPTATVLSMTTTCSSPRALAKDTTRNILYAACQASSSIMAWTFSSSQIGSPLSGSCNYAIDVTVNPSTGDVWAACLVGNNVAKFPYGGGAVTYLSGTCTNIYGVAVDPSTGDVFGTCQSTYVVARWIGGAGTQQTLQGSCTNVANLYWHSPSSTLYGNCDNGVMRWSSSAIASNTAGTLVTGCGGEAGFTSYYDSSVYIFAAACQPTNQIGVWDTASSINGALTILSDTSCTTPLNVAFDDQGNLYTACWGSNSIAEFARSSIQGDPQFVGFMGQKFQVHGVPNKWYYLIKSPKIIMSGLFKFLNGNSFSAIQREQRKKNYRKTKTVGWTHTGNYISDLIIKMTAKGFTNKNNNKGLLQIEIGSGTTGFSYVVINKNEMDLSLHNKNIRILFSNQKGYMYRSFNITGNREYNDDRQSNDKTNEVVSLSISDDNNFITLNMPPFQFKFSNSDQFINIDWCSFDSSCDSCFESLEEFDGLLGHTLSTVRHSSGSSYYELPNPIEHYEMMHGLDNRIRQ